MEHLGWRVWMAALIVAAGGCRTATRVVRVERVDLEVTGGNRGYLIGAAPAAAQPVQTTREMVETDVEIPSFYKPTPRPRQPIDVGMVPPRGTERGEAEPAGYSPASAYDTHVVQKGETLWSIAAKPEIYGDASKWRDIFDANRELLTNPDRLQPGMQLKIPRWGESTTWGSDEEPGVYAK